MRGVVFHGRERDCFVPTVEAALILRELRRVAFDAGDSASAAAAAISDGLAAGQIGPLPQDQAAAVQAVLPRLATLRPDAEALTTLHDALALDTGVR